MNSCLYVGTVRHRRHTPVEHSFRYPLFMLQLDLDELPDLFSGRWLWSASRPTLAWFRRRDHIGPPQQSLVDTVRDLVASKLQFRPAGPIRLLTHLRYFGYVFNPISIYYCWNEAATAVDAIVADVSNTPWNERHQYVLDCRPRNLEADLQAAHHLTGERELWFEKRFHVSPFMPMNITYRWQFTPPGDSLVVHMENHSRSDSINQQRLNEEGNELGGADHDQSAWEHPSARPTVPMFDATLSLRRREITTASLAGILLRFPWMTGRLFAAIYWQALMLWWKRVAYVPHPATSMTDAITPGLDNRTWNSNSEISGPSQSDSVPIRSTSRRR